MAICTWITDNEKETYSKVSDPELNELFQEVRERFQSRLFLREMVVKPKRGFWSSWFKKEQPSHVYVLYYDPMIGGKSYNEVQCINFCRDTNWSLNTVVPKSYIMTYFYGLLNGADRQMEVL